MWRSDPANHFAPLGAYLAEQAAAGKRQVVLLFSEIEVVILRRALPPEARTSLAWWQSRGLQPHAWSGWLRTGWIVARVSLALETVTFARPDHDERGLDRG